MVEEMADVTPGVAFDLSVNLESRAFIGSILDAEVSSRHALTLTGRQETIVRCEPGRAWKTVADTEADAALYPSLLSSRPLAVTPAGGEVSMGSWPGRRPRGGACPGLESELSWGVSWLDMEEPEGRMGALLNSAGEKSLQGKRGKKIKRRGL